MVITRYNMVIAYIYLVNYNYNLLNKLFELAKS